MGGPAAGRTQRSNAVKALLVVIVGVTIYFLLFHSSSGASSKVRGRVVRVTARGADHVRVYVDWTNTGKAAGSVRCVIDTTVHNESGHVVNVRSNATGTNGKVEPGHTQKLYQDIAVDHGDAPYVHRDDVKLKGC